MPDKEVPTTGPLEGIEVLELSRVGPGEFCTVMLADMGAEVLKIEAPPSAMPASFGSSPGAGEGHKLATSYINRNKWETRLATWVFGRAPQKRPSGARR
ncbi:MAG: CoA transferase [Dehalococcoidia bacterium]